MKFLNLQKSFLRVSLSFLLPPLSFLRRQGSSLIFFLFLVPFFLLPHLLLAGEDKNYLTQAPEDNLLHFSYATDLNSGASSYTYDFVLPSARALTPQLTLNYSNYNTLSEFGLGWGLNTPTISRSLKRGIPTYTDEDTFILNGFGTQKELVHLGKGVYRPLLDETDLKILRSENSWVVLTTQGVQYHFEKSVGEESKVFEWKLTRIQNLLGHFIEYVYEDLGDDHNPYVREILYNGGPQLKPNFKTILSYSQFKEKNTTYKKGIAFSQSYKCDSLNVFYLKNNSWESVLSYELIYKNTPHNQNILLSEIRKSAKDLKTPPVTFQYREQREEWATQDFPHNSTHKNTMYLDVNGDGLVDKVVQENGNIVTYLNGQEAQTSAWSISGESFETGTLADFDGDGFIDFAVSEIEERDGGLFKNKTRTRKKFLKGTQNGFIEINKNIPKSLTFDFEYVYDVQSFEAFGNTTYQKLTTSDKFNAGVLILDLNGDGYLDILTSRSDNNGFFPDYTYKSISEENSVFLGTNDGWVETNQWHLSQNLFYHPTESYNTYILDYNGDGLSDIIAYRHSKDKNVTLFLNNGGDWIQKDISEWLSYFENKTVQFLDINQDGVSDLVTKKGKTIEFYILKNAQLEKIELTLQADLLSDLKTLDYNQDGIQDFVVKDKVYVNPYKKEVLIEIDNGFGGRTNIEYASSSQFHDNRFPFNLEVVSRVKKSSGFGESETLTYEYDWGRINLENRDFLGFHRVQETSTETPSAEAFSKVSYFSHDALLHGKPEVLLFCKGSSCTEENRLTRTELIWSYLWPDEETKPAPFKKPVLNSKISYIFDGDKNPLKYETHYTYEWAYDGLHKAFLKASQEKFLGQHIHHNFREDFLQDEQVSLKIFATNTQTWLQKIAKEEVKNIAYEEKPQSRNITYYYDNSALGFIKNGLLTALGRGKTVHTKFIYNDAGLKVGEVNAQGATTAYEYDPTLSFVVKETNPLGFITQKSWNPVCGTVEEVTDTANEAWFFYRYDTLCRIQSVQLPGDEASTTLNIDYSFDVPYRIHVTSQYGDEVYYYKDGLGRVLEQKTKQGENFITNKKVHYNKLGKVFKKYVPFSSNSDFVSEEPQNVSFSSFKFDASGNTLEERDAKGNVTTIQYKKKTKEVRDALGRIKKFHFNAFNNLVSLKEKSEEKWISTNYEYDTFGNILKIIRSDNSERVYEYNDQNLIIQAQDKKSDFHFGFSYDDLGNKTYEQTPNGGKSSTFLSITHKLYSSWPHFELLYS